MDDFAAAIPLLRQARRDGRAAVVVTVIGNTSELDIHPSQRMLVGEYGIEFGNFGPVVNDRLVHDARRAIEERRPRLRSYTVTQQSCLPARAQSGNLDIYFDLLARTPRLIVAGGGHIAQPLASIAKVLEFEVVVVDDRPEYANPSRFPGADSVLCGNYPETLSALEIDRDTYVVLVTRGHVHDSAALRAIIHCPAAYIGMIGSRKRVRTVLDTLSDEGFSRERLSTVYAPIGLDIGSTTPAEIAVAIVAEMIMVQRGGSVSSLKVSWP